MSIVILSGVRPQAWHWLYLLAASPWAVFGGGGISPRGQPPAASGGQGGRERKPPQPQQQGAYRLLRFRNAAAAAGANPHEAGNVSRRGLSFKVQDLPIKR